MASGEGLTLVRSDIMEEVGVGAKQNYSRVESSQGETRRERHPGGQYTALLRVGTHLKDWWKP